MNRTVLRLGAVETERRALDSAPDDIPRTTRGFGGGTELIEVSSRGGSPGANSSDTQVRFEIQS